MKTTLNEIEKHNPCRSGWKKLLKYLNKSCADDEPLDFTVILESNGIEDTVWCLKTQPYKSYCLFLADIAESVLPIFENKYPRDYAPKNAIDAIRKYHSGKITKNELRDAYAETADSADCAYYAYHADYTYYAAYAAYAAAYAYANADTVAHAVADTVAHAAAHAPNPNAGIASNWLEIERLFIKHFPIEI